MLKATIPLNRETLNPEHETLNPLSPTKQNTLLQDVSRGLLLVRSHLKKCFKEGRLSSSL